MSEALPCLLVTGGAGFIGSHWVRHVLESTTLSVVNLDALTYAGNLQGWGPWLHHPRHHFVHGSIADRNLLRHLLTKHRPQAVVHLAAESHVDRSIDGPQIFVETNVLGTSLLLEEATAYWRGLSLNEQQHFRFLHLSTDEVFGSLLPGDAPFQESTAYAPSSPYSASKAAADHLVRAWHVTYGLPTMVVHSSNNYGPRQYPEKLIPLALMKMLRGEAIPVYGDGGQIRDWLHVEDHCAALSRILALGLAGATYLVGTGRETTNRTLLELLCQIMDELHPRADRRSHARSMQQVVDRPGHDRRYAIDASLLRNTLNWQPQIDLVDGLRSTAQWYLNHPDWWSSILSRGNETQRRGRLLPHHGNE